MTYYIKCNNYRQAVVAANAFANHYCKDGVKVNMRLLEVKVDDDLFVFINPNTSMYGRRNGDIIPVEKFIDKYFTPNSQTP